MNALQCLLVAVLGGLATGTFAGSSTQIEPVGPLATVRQNHSATLLADGRVLMAGGRGMDGALASAEIFDPETQLAVPVGDMSAARYGHTATLLADGRVLMTGGNGGAGALASTEIFDPVTMSFQPGTPMNVARQGHTATTLTDGHVLMAGGDATGTAELFDPASGAFAAVASALSVQRTGHAAVLFSDSSVFLTGGGNASAEFFDPADETFTLVPSSMTVARTGHSSIATADAKLLLFGGDEAGTVERFDADSGMFTLAGTPGAQSSMALLLANENVLLIGPQTSGIYLPASDQFEPMTDAGLLQRRGATTTELAVDKKILVAGGVNANNEWVSVVALFNPAYVATDKDDYEPGSLAMITGGGFLAEEPVELHVLHADGTPDDGEDHERWTVTATAKGGIESSWHVCEDDCAGSLLGLSAHGLTSRLRAETRFTDGNIRAKSATNSVTFKLIVTSSTNTTCTAFSGAPVTNNNVNASTGHVIGVGSTASVRLEAAAISDQGGAFINWTSAFSFTTLGGDGRSICVIGFSGGGSREYFANYTLNEVPTCNAGGPYSSTCRYAEIDGASAADGDGDSLTYAWTSSNPNVTITSSNTLVTATMLAEDVAPNNVVSTLMLVVNDGKGGIASNQTTVTFNDNLLPSMVCPPDIFVQTDSDKCTATVADLGETETSDNCGVASVTNDAPSEYPVGTTVITWTATDFNGNQVSCPQWVIVTDETKPIVVCKNITVQLDENGHASITAADVDNGSTDNCAIESRELDRTSFDCSNLGTNLVILTVTDTSDNSDSCQASVIVQDAIKPMAFCNSLTIQLDESGQATISAGAIDDGSNDNCGIASRLLNKSSFNCSDLGENSVTLTVIDTSGNSDSCMTMVTVEDLIHPIARCQSITVNLDEAGEAAITAADLDDGSTDNCGIVSRELDRTNFDCSDIGTNLVTLTVTDAAGNSDSCETTVIVRGIATTTTVVSGNDTTLFGAPVTFTATVLATEGVPVGLVTFTDGITTLGTSALDCEGQATLTVSSLSLGAHTIRAQYNGIDCDGGSLSAPITQTIDPSGRFNISFIVRANVNGTRQLVPMVGAEVSVYVSSGACVKGKHRTAGIVYDGTDGPGGVDDGCEPVTYGSGPDVYVATGVTDADGRVLIVVPPLNGSRLRYRVIGRAMELDDARTPESPDALYSRSRRVRVGAGQESAVALRNLRQLEGRWVPANSRIPIND